MDKERKSNHENQCRNNQSNQIKQIYPHVHRGATGKKMQQRTEKQRYNRHHDKHPREPGSHTQYILGITLRTIIDRIHRIQLPLLRQKHSRQKYQRNSLQSREQISIHVREKRRQAN